MKNKVKIDKTRNNIRKNNGSKRFEKYKEKRKIDFKYNLSVYWSFLKNYKFLLFFILVIIIAMELFRLASNLLFKLVIDNGSEYFAAEITRILFVKILFILGITYLGIHLLRAIFRWGYIHFLNRLSGRLMKDLRQRFFNHIIRLDDRFHTSNKTGSMISRLGRGNGAMESLTDAFLMNFTPLIVQLIVTIASLIYFDWVPAVIVVITSIIFVTYSYYLQKMQEDAKLTANQAEDLEKGNVADIFGNVESIRYYGKEAYIQKKYEKLTQDTFDKQVKNWDYFRWFDAGQLLIIGIGTIAVLWFPLIKFLNGEMTVGTLTFIYTVFGSLIAHLFGFVWGIRRFYRAMADFQDLFAYGKVEKEIKDKSNSIKIRIKSGEINFKDLNFKYDNRKLFKNFNLKINKNQKVALVGHSGCGKSTLVKLLYRMYDVNSGAIIIDGQDIRDVKQDSLRSGMSIVPQEAILFDDTVYNNIRFSKPNASRDEVMKAMKFAQLDKFVKDLPKKEQTIVGERGVKLSGGEKQRVSIARAILADKKILVLDEATSALDSETEHEIQRDLAKLMLGRTSIMIAHRLSTIMHADVIVVMKKGQIVEMGKHNSLIKKNGEYKKLWNLQKGGYIK